jgi:hypothetical protein
VRTFAWLLIFAADGFALALAVYKSTHKQPFAGAYLALIGLAALAMSVWSLRSAARLGSPLDPLESGRIAMQVSSEAAGSTLFWAFGFLVGAIALAENPGILWARWLGYPGALVALALAGIVLLGARGENVRRYIADAHGFEERSGLPGTELSDQEDKAEETRTKIAWSEVGAVKRIESRTRGSSVSRNYRTEKVLKRELVFFGRKGERLLAVDDGLDPPDRYRLFLESIPRWTGLAIAKERKY